jgi:hypothetical protein
MRSEYDPTLSLAENYRLDLEEEDAPTLDLDQWLADVMNTNREHRERERAT